MVSEQELGRDRHRIRNLYYMLAYAYQGLSGGDARLVDTEAFDNVHDLCAAILARAVEAQVKQGLNRDYVSEEAALVGVRGRILIGESIRARALPLGRLVCVFDEFETDTVFNQLVKSTMLLLLRLGRVKAENKQALRRLLPYFSGVTEVRPDSFRWDRLHYTRGSNSYQFLVEVCRLVVEDLLQTTREGAHKLLSWLPDEAMSGLYERFIREYYRRHHPEFKAGASPVMWNLTEAGTDCAHRYSPVMKTDITMTHGDKCLIIDAKYYSKIMSDHWDRRTFKADNLYQIYAYVKNKAATWPGEVAGCLLYAATDEEAVPNDDMVIDGNLFSIRIFNLDEDWAEITRQLEDLCRFLA